MNKIEYEYKNWLKTEIYPKLGLGFHPDENFTDYINLETKEPTFTKEEAEELNSKMEYFFDKLGNDVYGIGFDELKKFHPELDIGSDVQESKNIMSFSQFVNEQLISENFEVLYTEHNCRGSKKFKKESDAIKFTKDFIKNKDDKKLSEIALYYGPVTNSSDTSKVIAWWDKGNNYFSNLSKKDSNLASKKINENKKDFVTLPNTNIELKYYKNDGNGNPMISCSFINRSNFQIQTGSGTGLVETEYILSRQKFNELSNKDLKIIEKEIVDYIENFGSKLQKQNLRKDRDYNSEHGINESLKKKLESKLTNKAQDTLLKVGVYFGEYFLNKVDEVEISIKFKINPFSKSNYKSIEFYYDLEHEAFNLRIETETTLLPEYAIENSLDSKEIINTIDIIKNNKY